MRQFPLIAGLFAVLTLAARGQSAPLVPIDSTSIAPNDNRVPAGRLAHGTLALSLETRMGRWFPDGPNHIDVPVEAFAEIGRNLQIPGRLVRVPLGTIVVAHVRNAVPGTVLAVHGLLLAPPGAGIAGANVKETS